MNSVNAIGRLVSEPDVAKAGETDICRMRLAVQRRGQDKGAVFFDVKTFNGQARACAEYLSTGDEVAVSGRLELDEWEHEGQKRSRLYVVAERVEFLRKARRNGDGSEAAGEQEPAAASASPSEDVAL
jgi:single-strand DNA-binding protein